MTDDVEVLIVRGYGMVQGQWQIVEVSLILNGPDVGDQRFRCWPLRWWHPGDVLCFIRDRVCPWLSSL